MATKPSPTQTTTGQKITAALLNGAYDVWNFLDRVKPLCHAFETAGQSIPSGGLNTVTLGGEYWDTDNMHSTTVNPSRITIQTAGVYRVWGATAWASNVTGTRGGIIKMNGTVNVEPTYTQVAATNFNTVCRLQESFVSCVVGDYFELQAYQNSGAALALTTTAGMRTSLGAEYIGTLQ